MSDFINETIEPTASGGRTDTSARTGRNKPPKNAATRRTKKVEKPANKKQTKALMYLGPNVPGGRLFTGALFKECQMPKHLDPLFEALPEMRELLVECQDVPQFKVDLQEQGRAAYLLFQQVQLRIREGALKNVL